MDFLQVLGFNIKEGRFAEYQEWIQQNEKELAQSLPEGVEYVGTYATIYSSHPQTGTVWLLTRMDSYAAQDRLAEAMKTNEVLARLQAEGMAFSDNRNDADWSNFLLKSMSDVSIVAGS